MPDLEKAQTYMREQAIDGWLLYDFRESNPVFWYLLGMKQQTTRRNYLFIPARGQARLLAHGLDKLLFEDVRVPVELYTSWQEMQAWHGGKVREMLKSSYVMRDASRVMKAP